jgi:hypothetical protein
MNVMNGIDVAPDALGELSGMAPDGSPIVLINLFRDRDWAIDPPETRHENIMDRHSFRELAQ